MFGGHFVLDRVTAVRKSRAQLLLSGIIVVGTILFIIHLFIHVFLFSTEEASQRQSTDL